MSRPSNEEVCAGFRQLLTEGCPEDLREPTRAWRASLWRAFAELQVRLCPTPPAGPSNDDQPEDGDDN